MITFPFGFLGSTEPPPVEEIPEVVLLIQAENLSVPEEVLLIQPEDP